MLPSPPTTARLHPCAPAIAGANADSNDALNLVRSTLLHATNDARGTACSTAGAGNTSGASLLEAECACATSSTPTIKARRPAMAAARRLRARDLLDLLLKLTLLFA